MQQGNDTFRLIVRRGPQPNQTYDLSKDIITIGRDITNDIVINDPEVSRHHLRFTRGAGGFTLEDLGSTNGTFINGQRLTGAKPLSNGDMIGLGETVTLGYEIARAASGEAAGPAPTAQSAIPQQPSGSPFAPGAAPQQPQQPIQSGFTPPPSAPSYTEQPAPSSYSPSGGFAPEMSAAPAAPPASNYYGDGYQEESGGNNTVRAVLIGCAGVTVLCCCVTLAAAYYIDTQCLWWQIPVVGDALRAFGQEPSLTFEACARLYGG
jgi:pSer/pThr/pTyr-binding forkhead associated (FHA) protein